jgi:NADPH-dependent 2,4-dienoyl-CoA reductase/sulfur reductase-like enzyme
MSFTIYPICGIGSCSKKSQFRASSLTVMSSRREFLKQTSLATGGLLLASSSFGNIFIGKKRKVIIIGASFAGLSAAYSLYKKGIDFVILEEF